MALTLHRPESRMLTSGQHAPLVRSTEQPKQTRLYRANAQKEGLQIRRRGLYLGRNAVDSEPTYLDLKHLRTHIHLIGPTGQGKSRLLLWLFQLMCYTKRPIILIDPKGDLYRAARNWALLNGFKKRLVLFDLSSDFIPGYNPLRAGLIRTDLQAQWVRESVKSAWGQGTFNATPQLARMLYLCLYVGTALSLDLVESLNVLRPASSLRMRALARIDDPFVKGTLSAFDQLNDRRKEELAASTLARLEAFCCDAVVREVLCSATSIDFESVLRERRIFLVNAAKYQPVLPDQLKLLLRFMINDLIATTYKGHGEGRFDENNPVYLIADEVQNLATRQFCDILDEGRGIGMYCIIAHQYMRQLADEDTSGYLLHSVKNDARTKVLFGGLDAEDLDAFADNLLLNYFDPLRIKYVQRTPFLMPKESGRWVKTQSVSQALATSTTDSKSLAESVSFSQQHSETRGRSVGNSVAFSEGGSETYTHGRNASITESSQWSRTKSENGSHTNSRAHTAGQTNSHGQGHGFTTGSGSTQSLGTQLAAGQSAGSGRSATASVSEGQTMLPPEEGMLFTDDPEVVSLSTQTGATIGESSFAGTNTMHGSSSGYANSTSSAESTNSMNSVNFSSSDTEGGSDNFGWSIGATEGGGIAHQTGESEAYSTGTNWNETRGLTITDSENITDGFSKTQGETVTKGQAVTEGETNTRGESISYVPFYEYIREWIETPVFMSPEEQKLLVKQRLKRVLKAHILVIPPERPDCILSAPYVDIVTIGPRRLEKHLQDIHGKPSNDHPAADVIDVEVREISKPHPVAPLPSPAPVVQPETEEQLWARLKEMSFGRRVSTDEWT